MRHVPIHRDTESHRGFTRFPRARTCQVEIYQQMPKPSFVCHLQSIIPAPP